MIPSNTTVRYGVHVHKCMYVCVCVPNYVKSIVIICSDFVAHIRTVHFKKNPTQLFVWSLADYWLCSRKKKLWTCVLIPYQKSSLPIQIRTIWMYKDSRNYSMPYSCACKQFVRKSILYRFSYIGGMFKASWKFLVNRFSSLSGLLCSIFIGTNWSHCYSSVRDGLNFSLHSNTYAYYSNSMQSTFIW